MQMFYQIILGSPNLKYVYCEHLNSHTINTSVGSNHISFHLMKFIIQVCLIWNISRITSWIIMIICTQISIKVRKKLQKQSFADVLQNTTVILKNFPNFTRMRLCWSLFLIKLQACGPATLLKSDSNTGFFLWNLRSF